MKIDVTIINFGDTGNEPFVIRDLAEAYGATTLLQNVGKPSDFLSSLNEADSSYIVLSLHGDKKGFILPELGSEVAAKEKYSDYLTAKDLVAEVKLKDSIVISTACKTGSQDFGQVFLKGGAKFYIAPDGYPEGSAIPFFLSHFFYGLLARKKPLKSAFREAKGQDSETKLFRSYS